MRPIKFRAWDRNTKKWLEHPSDVRLEINNERVYHRHQNGDYYSADACGEHDIVLMQFTGLLDKRGKEMYEGDVVHYRYHPYPPRHPSKGMWNVDYISIIEWESTAFVLTPLPGQGGLRIWFTSIPYGEASRTPNDLFEVLGNIYEHPKLVKSQP